MSYRVLARKYRPQTFDDLIGQAHVATTLINALKNQKVAHAYLFSGPRGVGKTTTARILAKALNCEKGPTPKPCGKCDYCLRIAQGQEIVDVMEIDAASNRGIEEIRELRENVVYAPAHTRYKVYIIDEAHQITHDAFNAFLKTLEEPPAHAVFILATTEHQKIPATILSRCQLFRFKRISTEEITGRLENILGQEKIKVDKDALVRIARAAGGSVRDALSLLDQALAYSDELNVQQVEMLLGFLPEEFLQGFVATILDKQPNAVLEWIKRLSDEGWDLPQFVRDFREYLRESLVAQLAAGAKPDALTFAQKTVSLAELLQIIKVMGQTQDDMRWNDNPRLVLELYSLRLTQPFVDAGALLNRIDQLEKGIGAELKTSSPAVSGRGPIVDLPPSKQDSPPVTAGNDKVYVPAPPAAQPKPASRPSSDTVAQWKQFIAEMWKKPLLGTQMEKARLQSATDREWVIAFVDKFGVDIAQRSQGLIQETVTKVAGGPVMVRFVQDTGAPKDPEPWVVTPSRDERAEERQAAPERPLPERQPVMMKDEGVQKVLQAFKGRIRAQEDE